MVLRVSLFFLLVLNAQISRLVLRLVWRWSSPHYQLSSWWWSMWSWSKLWMSSILSSSLTNWQSIHQDRDDYYRCCWSGLCSRLSSVFDKDPIGSDGEALKLSMLWKIINGWVFAKFVSEIDQDDVIGSPDCQKTGEFPWQTSLLWHQMILKYVSFAWLSKEHNLREIRSRRFCPHHLCIIMRLKNLNS